MEAVLGSPKVGSDLTAQDDTVTVYAVQDVDDSACEGCLHVCVMLCGHV